VKHAKALKEFQDNNNAVIDSLCMAEGLVSINTVITVIIIINIPYMECRLFFHLEVP